LILALGLFIGMLAVGTIGYMVLEHLSLLDALYLTVTTVSTVGYGDVVAKSLPGRMFTIGLILFGVGSAFYVFSSIFQVILEGKLRDLLGRKGMERRIERMSGHIIVCGAGRVGSEVMERLQQEKEDFIVIDQNAEICQGLIDKWIPAIQGDATLDSILLKAGVERARGIITTIAHDAENVYVTLTARSLNRNPDFLIVARANRSEAIEKLKRSGASNVISPEIMGGRQMATAMTKPAIVDLMDNVFYNEELHLDIAEIRISSTSSLVGTSLAVCGIKEQYDSLIVGIHRAGVLLTHVSSAEVIQAGDILLVIGHRERLKQLASVGTNA
jgi:voltage-gated potassium channel